jgi:hypothetical protein
VGNDWIADRADGSRGIEFQNIYIANIDLILVLALDASRHEDGDRREAKMEMGTI